MTLFRDWPRTLRRASFRGVPFHVDHHSVETGRRLVVHEFPGSDLPYVEDLGRQASKITVTAYTVGNLADFAAAQLQAACDRAGAGPLVLPHGRLDAHCDSCKRDASKDKLGYIAFELKFVRAGLDVPAAALPPGFLAARIGLSSRVVITSALTRFLLALDNFGRSGLLLGAAGLFILDIAALLDWTARGLGLAAPYGPRVIRGIADLSRLADSFVRVGGGAHVMTPTSFRLARPETAPPSLVVALRQILDDLRLGCPPEQGVAALAALAAFEAPETVPAARSPNRRQAAANARMIAEALRVVALAGYAEAVAARPLADRREAIQARADAAEVFAAELERLEPGPGAAELHRAIATLAGELAEYLSRRVADLAPVLTIEAQASMPSLWWANRLYGTPDRAGELRARNRATSGLFMPTTIEALAR